jgi:hypothetical protein
MGSTPARQAARSPPLYHPTIPQLAAVLQPISASHRAYVDRHFLPNEVDPSDHLPIGAVLRLPTA